MNKMSNIACDDSFNLTSQILCDKSPSMDMSPVKSFACFAISSEFNLSPAINTILKSPLSETLWDGSQIHNLGQQEDIACRLNFDGETTPLKKVIRSTVEDFLSHKHSEVRPDVYGSSFLYVPCD